MGLLARALQVYMPEYIRRKALEQLLSATAAAFEAEVPPITGLDSRECLARYARFTQAQAERRLRAGRDLERLSQRLYWNSVELGQRQTTWLRPGSMADVMAIARMLYSILDIDFQGDAQGQVVINRCYFSRFYSSQECRLMSAMDRGLLAGLSTGGELTFTARITEGETCCRAVFSLLKGKP